MEPMSSTYQSVKRSMNEAEDQEHRTALIDREKLYDAYDPDSRSGRPSGSHSRNVSGSGSPLPMYLAPDSTGMDATSAASRASAKRNATHVSPFLKIMAGVRPVVVILALLAAIGVLGVNASILATYNASRAGGKWMDESGSQKSWWDAWPANGIDMRPITAYVGLSSLTIVVMIVLFAWSARNRFKHVSGTATIVAAVVTLLLSVTWVAFVILYQRQSTSGSDKHSYRTWACSHTDKDLYGLNGVSLSGLCTKANAARYGGIAQTVLCFLVFVTLAFACCASGRSKGYGKLNMLKGDQSWMPRWRRN